MGRETAVRRFLHIRSSQIKVFAYIDGFNLYYRALLKTPHKWLNVDEMLQLVYPGLTIDHIRYFTARVKPSKSDSTKHDRQSLYLRALSTLPNVSLHFGRFTKHPAKFPTLKTAHWKRPKIVEVMKTEEKGSDVNLGAFLVDDAHRKRFDTAIVVTNDSDLITPIELVTKGLGLEVWFLNTCGQKAGGLKRAATSNKELRKWVLPKAQFPIALTDGSGTFHKPPTW